MGIHIAAAVATVLSLGLIGGALFYRSPRSAWPALALAILLQLPMCLLAYSLVRIPLEKQVERLVHDRQTFASLKTVSAPLTEEPAKLWPLLIPFFRRFATPENRVRLGVALGLGFGLGEMWFLADLLAHGDPKTASLPWYLLGGFINERFMVCAMHGAFTASALYFGGWRGFAAAFALHYFGNLPIFLALLDPFGWSKAAYTTALGIWVCAYFVAMLAWLAKMAAGNWKLGQFLFGDATCPDCGQLYPRPLFGLNMGPKRYERCPHCRRWHLL